MGLLDLFARKKRLIFLFASRRGGSTILAQIIAGKQNIGIIDQPFDLWKPQTNRGKMISDLLPSKSMSQFFAINNNEREQIDRYLNSIYQGKLNTLANHPKSSQFILKIVNAHGLIDELTQMVPNQTIALIRHPCAQACSVVRNQWGTCEEPFLNNLDWSKKYLSAEQLKFGKKISENGSYFSKAVLNWCLEWHYPLKYAFSSFFLVKYEELLTASQPTIIKLFDFLQLKHFDEAIAELMRPSISSSYSTSTTLDDIEKGNKRNLLLNWRKHVSDNDIKMAQNILDVFEVKEYHTNSNSPI